MIRRIEKTITLGDGADAVPVTVKEITPAQALHFHRAVFGSVERAGGEVTPASIADLIVGDHETKIALLVECSSLGAEVHELGASYFLALWGAFEEVNAPFLDALAARLKKGAVEWAKIEATQNSTPPQSQAA